VRGEVVKAFIILKEGTPVTKELSVEIQEFVKRRLAAHEYPREIEFVKELPLTATGKIMRKELRKMEVERKAKKIV
jgi:acetyl-CoA synthetase